MASIIDRSAFEVQFLCEFAKYFMCTNMQKSLFSLNVQRGKIGFFSDTLNHEINVIIKPRFIMMCQPMCKPMC